MGVNDNRYQPLSRTQEKVYELQLTIGYQELRKTYWTFATSSAKLLEHTEKKLHAEQLKLLKRIVELKTTKYE